MTTHPFNKLFGIILVLEIVGVAALLITGTNNAIYLDASSLIILMLAMIALAMVALSTESQRARLVCYWYTI